MRRRSRLKSRIREKFIVFRDRLLSTEDIHKHLFLTFILALSISVACLFGFWRGFEAAYSQSIKDAWQSRAFECESKLDKCEHKFYRCNWRENGL